jgi:multiple sugar transport system permease protein
MKSAKLQKTVLTAVTHMVLVCFACVFVIPLLWQLSTSLKQADETLRNPPVWIPAKLNWQNFPDAITYGSKDLGYIPFLVYARNTILLTILTVTGSVLSNALVAYSFARLRWPGRDAFFSITIATMMIPFPVMMVPSFVMFTNLGWVGSYKPLWIPAFFAGAFNIYLLRQFFRTIPMGAE